MNNIKVLLSIMLIDGAENATEYSILSVKCKVIRHGPSFLAWNKVFPRSHSTDA